MRPELHSLPPLPETPKQEVHSERDSLAAFASANPETPLAIRPLPEEKQRAMQLLPEMVHLELAMWSANPLAPATQSPWAAAGLAVAAKRLLRQDLRSDARLAEQDSVRARHPAERATLQELQHQPAEDSPVPPEHARRCSPSPGPYASSQEILAARKCNRAAHCGGHPISGRCRSLRNRRGLAGCDNKCSRSQRRRARRARPFLIAASDKHRCHPPPFAD